MGWSYGWYSRKQLIEYLTKGWESGTATHRCLKWAAKGNVLYMVFEHGDAGREPIRSLEIALLRRGGKEDWGYKGMDETWGVGYYTCPLTFFDDVPCPDNDVARQWRSEVRQKAENRRGMMVDGWVRLTRGCTPRYIQVRSVRPLRFHCYKVRRQLIESSIPEANAVLAKMRAEFPPVVTQTTYGQRVDPANSWQDSEPSPETRERMITFAKAHPFPEDAKAFFERVHVGDPLRSTWLQMAEQAEGAAA
jgi:hypothetical protein